MLSARFWADPRDLKLEILVLGIVVAFVDAAVVSSRQYTQSSSLERERRDLHVGSMLNSIGHLHAILPQAQFLDLRLCQLPALANCASIVAPVNPAWLEHVELWPICINTAND